MTMREAHSHWVLQAFGIAFLLSVAIGPFLVPESRAAEESRVHHIVICWLKESGNDAARQELIEAVRGLKDIPGVLDVHAGAVLPSDRPIVDSSFDVAIIFTFSDQETMKAYLTHPTHRQALKQTIRPLVREFLVYDFAE